MDSIRACLLPATLDVLQAAGLVNSTVTKATTASTRVSTLGRSQSSRQTRPSVLRQDKQRSILGDEEMDGDAGLFSRARHTSLLSFDSIGSSFRAMPPLEPATAFESGVLCVCVCVVCVCVCACACAVNIIQTLILNCLW